MLKSLVLPGVVGVLALLLAPNAAHAYGAAHVGYTQVGPNGVHHEGATAVDAPRGDYAGRTNTYRGADDRTAYRGDYRYSPTYSTGSAHYAYVR